VLDVLNLEPKALGLRIRLEDQLGLVWFGC
jgi:hypothetical protein